MGRILKWVALLLFTGVVLLLIVYGRYVVALAGQYQMFLPPSFDDTPPELPGLVGSPRLLAFSKTNGYRHHDGIPAARAMLDALAAERGYGLFHTENAAVFDGVLLAGFDVVVLNNSSGALYTPSQQEALRGFVEGGGGLVALHAAGGDTRYEWPWYGVELIRAQFVDHPMARHIQPARLVVESNHPITAHLPKLWNHADEWYNFAASPRSRVNVLISIDEASYDPEKSPMGDDHPMVWWHALGAGRVVYSALGHVPDTYAEPLYRQLVGAAIEWTAPANQEN
jgi:type 1 glutamine amidotransferase